jgi:hypothetical protein
MAFALHTKMYNGCISTAVCPLQPSHVGLFVEDRRSCGAAIACCPFLQPCKYGRVVLAHAAIVGNDPVGRPMKLKERHWSYRMAASRVGRVRPGHRRECGQASCQGTRQYIRHASAI